MKIHGPSYKIYIFTSLSMAQKLNVGLGTHTAEVSRL
jgi:hypothetical protein